ATMNDDSLGIHDPRGMGKSFFGGLEPADFAGDFATVTAAVGEGQPPNICSVSPGIGTNGPV
ncbi:MAG: hypothetical protein HY851_07370, partial [candidate division Zixibacteria bacterium]|nr:hypothetical protein [candidate division Zixibacteria bacterium]